MASKINVFMDGYRNGSPQLDHPPLGEPWFHFWFSCFGGVQNATGMSYISISQGGKWDWIATVVEPNDVAAVLSTFVTLQPLNRNETLQSYEGLTRRLSIRIRKDPGPGLVASKVFEAMGPLDPVDPTLRSFALNLIDLLDGATNDARLSEIRDFVRNQAP